MQNTNPYLKNLNKLEFIITYACTGRCKHCSEGDRSNCREHIDPTVAANCVKNLSKKYGITTVMVFGGEPLLYPDTVYSIMDAAQNWGIPNRQVITNGFFSLDRGLIRDVAAKLLKCGVNDLLLSVDAFHQETIPLNAVKIFAEEIKNSGIPIKLQPAWLVSKTDDNPYNKVTREILESFADLNIPENEGNVIFPEGNALKYLSDYFKGDVPENPYVEDPYNVKCLSVAPNGDVLNGNLYRRNIIQITDDYAP